MNTLQHIVQTSPKPRKEIAKNTKKKIKNWSYQTNHQDLEGDVVVELHLVEQIASEKKIGNALRKKKKDDRSMNLLP